MSKGYWYRIRRFALQTFKSKNVVRYLFFVMVATVFWFLHALGKQYISNVQVDVRFENFPLDKEPKESGVQPLTLNVTAYGFSLVRLQIKSTFQDFRVNLKDLRENVLEEDLVEYFLSTPVLRKQFDDQLGSGISINSVFPEQVRFHVQEMKVKKLPVISDLKLGLKSGYMFISQPKISPDSVVVRGPKSLVEPLVQIGTVEDMVENISESFSRKVSLKSPSSEVILLNDRVTVEYDVAEYIDEEKVLKIKPLNFPDSLQIKLYPSEVTMKYRTYTGAREQLGNEDVILVADYETLNKFSQRIEVQLLSLPKGMFNIQINPRYVDYVITHK